MKKNDLKKVIIIGSCVLFSSLALAFAFDWPDKDDGSSVIISHFGQLRGGTLETSLIFRDKDNVYSSEHGKVVMQIREHDCDMGWFESPLGNADIISHSNDIYTVYGNLSEENLNDYRDGAVELIKGSYLGIPGESGWREEDSGLEFQLLDLKNKTAINPKIVLPRTGREKALTTGTVILEDRRGNIYDLEKTDRIPSEAYRIYKVRQNSTVPFETSLSVNGVTIDTISYDSIRENEGRICVSGKNQYYTDILYPDEERQFLASTTLFKGKNVFRVTLTDITGHTKTSTFTVEVY